jgi:myo-inositol 2-dehydrogenase / D-chiro-inositol 1-dehydrogenase
MLKVAVIGGGNHSSENHLPALKRYASLHPGEIELAAFCDLNRETVERVSREYGFARCYTDLDELLSAEGLDACIAITPVPATARIASQILRAEIPLLMEKPPGATPEETQQICNLVQGRNSRVMVSMNRRFDPTISAARSWIAQRPLRHLHASMLRHDRRESDFITDTAIHCVDAVRGIAGDIRDYSVRARQVDGVWWYSIDLEFQSGATGVVEVMPSCGSNAECYEMFGAGYRALARVGQFDSGTFTAWENGRLVRQEDPSEGLPPFVRNGTYAETVEFFCALKGNRPSHPTPAEVRPSVDLCHQIRHQVQLPTA